MASPNAVVGSGPDLKYTQSKTLAALTPCVRLHLSTLTLSFVGYRRYDTTPNIAASFPTDHDGWMASSSAGAHNGDSDARQIWRPRADSTGRFLGSTFLF